MDTSLFQLEGKNALVVGGGQGMGESAAKLLAQVGCGVAVADVNGGAPSGSPPRSPTWASPAHR